MRYDNYSDDSAAVAVDFVNAFATVPLVASGHGDEAHDLAAFLRHHDLDDTGVTAADIARARRLADRLHEVFTADDPARAVDIVNDVLATIGARPNVSGHDGEPWHLHYLAADAAPLDQLLVTAAMGLATVLCASGTSRFGHCDGLACRDVYVDTSRNNRRRFCSDGCANLVHVTAHRARRRDEEPAD